MKKAIAMFLTLAMGVTMLAGCGNSSSSTTAGGGETPAADTAESAADNGETPTLPFFDKNSGSKQFDDPVALELMKRTGINIEVVNPTGDPAEKLALMLAGKDYPDIVLMDRGSDIVNKYIEAGALVNLTDYLDQMPNVTEMYGDTLKKTRWTDGQNYYLSNWYGMDPDPVNGFILRYDIMCELVGKDRADSDEPFTTSEMMDIFRQYKEKYPEVDGKETFALTLADEQDSKNAILGMYGMKTYYEKDGQLYWDIRDPRYLEAMHFINGVHQEGLLEKEWVSNNDELFNQKLATGNILGYMGAYWNAWTANSSLTSTVGEDANYLAYKVVPDGYDADKTTLGGRSSLGWDAIAVTNNCKNLDAALKFIDYCASQEGQDLLLWGIEGKDWTKDGDTYVPNEEVLDGLQNNLEKTREETGITRWTWFVRNASTHKDGSPCRMQMSRKDITATWAEKNLTNTYWDTAEFDNLIPTGNDPVALKAQKVQDIIKQAYPKMINAASDEELDKIYNQMIADCDAAGMEEVEAKINENYQARMAIWNAEN